MNAATPLVPAAQLAAANPARFPGESAEYRAARTALLAEEIELRRHIERVAALRRQLPPGGAIPEDYLFQGLRGPVRFSELFGTHDTLVTYNFMYGPQRSRPCPMCTSLLGAFEGGVADIQQRVAFAVLATSPVERLLEFARERGWRHLPFYSSAGTTFNRDYAGETADSGDHPALNVFRRTGTVIRHFWGGEMGGASADPGQDPRGAPDLAPLWNVLDMTPGGRDPKWYPKLDY
jgi:predicted dithiol-disulfide oxidoreductase (DUF899 family)